MCDIGARDRQCIIGACSATSADIILRSIIEHRRTDFVHLMLRWNRCKVKVQGIRYPAVWSPCVLRPFPSRVKLAPRRSDNFQLVNRNIRTLLWSPLPTFVEQRPASRYEWRTVLASPTSQFQARGLRDSGLAELLNLRIERTLLGSPRGWSLGLHHIAFLVMGGISQLSVVFG